MKSPHHSKQEDYIATFPAGAFDVIARQLKRFTIDDLKILEHDESAVMFRTQFTQERLIEMRFFTNVYMVINTDHLRQYKRFIKTESFRLFEFTNGAPTEIAPETKQELTALIEEQLHIKPNVSRFSHDFVIHRRTMGEPVLTLRLSRAKHKREDVRAGSLRPELANILLLTAAPSSSDTLLDPFAGYGAIPKEAVRGFGVKNVIAVEKNDEAAQLITQKGVRVHTGDATNLYMLLNNTIDRVVTDPPWGNYDDQNVADLHEVYEKSLSEIHRVLKPQGTAVVLSGNDVLDTVLTKALGMKMLKSYPILVSGKKATVFKLQKIKES